MPTAPTPSTPIPRARPFEGTWTLQKRQVAGIALGLFCLGIIIGARIGRGSIPPEAFTGERVVVKSGPCPDCAERAVQESRQRNVTQPAPAPPINDVPVTPRPVDSVATTDMSKAHVMDATFIESATPGDSSVPGM